MVIFNRVDYVNKVLTLLGDEFICTFHLRVHTTTHTFDHVYPGSENNSQTVILYGLIGTDSFLDAHKKMVELSANGSVKYILRHYTKVCM